MAEQYGHMYRAFFIKGAWSIDLSTDQSTENIDSDQNLAVTLSLSHMLSFGYNLL